MLKTYICLVGLFLVTLVKAKIGYFWHITDIHYDFKYSTRGDNRKNCWQNDVSAISRPGKFGDYNCDSPWALIESAATAMKEKHGDNIEFVLWTGDSLSATASGKSTEMQKAALQNLTNLLSTTFTSQFVFPVLGHDDPGSKPGERLGYKDIAQWWKQWLPTEAIQTFSKGGYYTIERKENKLRIIALNTNLYSSLSGNEEPDPQGQWAWLESVLNKAHRSKETVYLVGHMAPGPDERQADALPQFEDKFSRRYIQLVRKYSDIIVGQFFGHLHSDTFRVIYNENENRPSNYILLSPAISPKRTASGPNNPALRLYKFETTTGQVLDYTQYYLDLTSANQKDTAEWQQEYNLTSYYGLTEVSAKSLHELAETFTDLNPSSQRFSKYFVANSVRLYSSPKMGRCDAHCAQTHYCAVTKLDYSAFRHCLEAAASALASANAAGLATAWLPSILAIVASLIASLVPLSRHSLYAIT